MGTIMKIKTSLFIYLLATATIVMPQETINLNTALSMNNIIYEPIASYQKMLSDMVYNLILAFLYKQTTAPKDIVTKETTPIVEVVIPEKPMMSREQALHEMKQITEKIFDSHDHDLLGKHLAELQILCKYLDKEADAKTIAAIKFLSENQHKAGPLDFVFWIQAIKKYELETTIPMTEAVKTKKPAEKLSALRKKMALQNEHSKQQANPADQVLTVV